MRAVLPCEVAVLVPNNKSPFILECSNINFSFAPDKPLFSSLNLRLPHGVFALVKGPSGTGKSTFLRLCNRLEEPQQGDILFDGASVRSMEPSLLRRQMAYVQQTPVVLDASIRDNLLLPFGFRQNKDLTPPTDAELQDALQRFVPDVSVRDNALTLSGGQRQRLCLLRALLLKPRLLLLDEPTSALDPENRAMVEEVVENLNREQGISVLFISHQDYVPRKVRRLFTIRIESGRAEVLTENDTESGETQWT